MLEGLIRDAKLAAMDVAQDIKDVVRDATTKLPDEKPISFDGTDKQQIQQPGLDYMNNNWGMMSATMTANQIDMIVGKMEFVANMIQNGLLSFDAIEQELRAIAASPLPPQQSQLLGIATRIDACQRQTFNGLQELRKLSQEVDRATDKLQNRQQAAGWNTQQNNLWNR